MAPPASHEVARASAMAFVKKFGFNNAICPEMPKILAKLTPGGQETYGLGIANDHRPDSALAVLIVLISIADPYLPPASNPEAGPRDIQAIRGQDNGRRRPDSRLGNERTQTCRHGGSDLGDQ